LSGAIEPWHGSPWFPPIALELRGNLFEYDDDGANAPRVVTLQNVLERNTCGLQLAANHRDDMRRKAMKGQV
jgi:hypothetical protein